MTTLKAGDFCWVELSTPNLNPAKQFYQELFNWDVTENPTDFGPYLMIKAGSEDIAGAFEVNQEMKDQGIPSVWSSYVLVSDVVASTQKAKELGANIIREPMDVMNIGKMSVFADPTGAVISLWQPNAQPSKNLENSVHGAPSWFELVTKDAKKAGDFYSKLFGWTAEKSATPAPMPYTTFKQNGNMMAGMMEISPEMGPIPPHWGVYFTVDDFEKSLEKAKKMGAATLYEPISLEGVGRFVGMKDPQGVVFSIIQYST